MKLIWAYEKSLKGWWLTGENAAPNCCLCPDCCGSTPWLAMLAVYLRNACK